MTSDVEKLSPSAKKGPPSTCFTCTRLNATTFQVIEDDKYYEQPLIYVKIYSDVLVIIDTGCGGASRDPDVSIRSLREYIETFPVRENDRKPLNEYGRKNYIVICTHCHYDHIGAIEQFNDPKCVICASSYEKEFLDAEHLPESSICRFLGIKVPSYHVSKWLDDGMQLQYMDKFLGLQVFHTPGHTPDEVAIWDPHESVLFVGDSMYEWAPIIFPSEGSVVKYSDSLGKLKGLVEEWNGQLGGNKVKIACGHTTPAANAVELLGGVDGLLYRVVMNDLKPSGQDVYRGEVYQRFEREDGKLAFLSPKRLFEEFRKDEEAMKKLQNRQRNE